MHGKKNHDDCRKLSIFGGDYQDLLIRVLADIRRLNADSRRTPIIRYLFGFRKIQGGIFSAKICEKICEYLREKRQW
jgi:hypothetical protein